MKIVADKYVPMIAESLAGIAEVICMEPEAITAEVVRDADALVIRTRTTIDEALLAGSKVQFVVTATIGYDHIDTAYCDAHHIAWTACPGCNAQAVCDYIEEGLRVIGYGLRTIGVVGYGHIGSLVAKMAEQRGMKVLLNDPPKGIGVPLEQIAREADIITFHVPLTSAPTPYPTYHLCDAAFLQQCKPEAVIINASRGGVVDETALLASGRKCIIDCWENEPNINLQLAQSPNTLLASYHIAGYSLEGKLNASRMCLEALAQHFGIKGLNNLKLAYGEADRSNEVRLETRGDTSPGWLQRVSEQLKAHPENFEQLRKQYKLR